MEVPGKMQRVLVVGNGHARKDYGLPNHLKGPLLSLGILEVELEKKTPADYRPERFDFIWFTPRVDDVDACEKYRVLFEKIRRSQKKRQKK